MYYYLTFYVEAGCWYFIRAGRKDCIRYFEASSTHVSVDHLIGSFYLVVTCKHPETNHSVQFKAKAEGRELGGAKLSITRSLKVCN